MTPPPAKPVRARKTQPVAPPLRLAPARREAGETVQEFAFRRLRHAIMTGRFPPGLAVTIRGLAALLEVSAMPVREAMRRLVAERALVMLDNRRVRVPAMDEMRFQTLIAARILLEQEAARRALPHVSAACLVEMRRLDAAAEQAFAAGDVEHTIEANFAFHRYLYCQAPCDALLPLIESVWLQIGPFMRLALEGVRIEDRPDRHADALREVGAGNAEGLARAIERDIREGLLDLAATPARRAA